MTGMFKDFLAEFQRSAGIDNPKQATVGKSDISKVAMDRTKVDVTKHDDFSFSMPRNDDITLPLSSRKLEKSTYQVSFIEAFFFFVTNFGKNNRSVYSLARFFGLVNICK